MKLSLENIERYNNLYDERFRKFGKSPKALGWWTGKQNIRYNILTKHFDLEGKSILDVGCGFADLYLYLNSLYHNFEYCGVDMNANLLNEAKKNIMKNSPNNKWRLVHSDFLDDVLVDKYDYVLASGCFSTRLVNQDNLEYVESVIQKAVELSRHGVALDFCSSLYGEQDSPMYITYNPLKVMEIAYRYSKRLLLINDYFPTEFSIIIFKNQDYNKQYIYDEYIIEKP